MNKGNITFADLRYGDKDGFCPSTQFFAATKGLLGIYTLYEALQDTVYILLPTHCKNYCTTFYRIDPLGRFGLVVAMSLSGYIGHLPVQFF